MVDENTPVTPVWTAKGEGSADDGIDVDPPDWVDHLSWIVVGTRKSEEA